VIFSQQVVPVDVVFTNYNMRHQWPPVDRRDFRNAGRTENQIHTCVRVPGGQRAATIEQDTRDSDLDKPFNMREAAEMIAEI